MCTEVANANVGIRHRPTSCATVRKHKNCGLVQIVGGLMYGDMKLYVLQ